MRIPILRYSPAGNMKHLWHRPSSRVDLGPPGAPAVPTATLPVPCRPRLLQFENPTYPQHLLYVLKKSNHKIHLFWELGNSLKDSLDSDSLLSLLELSPIYTRGGYSWNQTARRELDKLWRGELSGSPSEISPDLCSVSNLWDTENSPVFKKITKGSICTGLPFSLTKSFCTSGIRKL